MGCDMCGADGELFVCAVEGVDMQLCNNCKIYGEIKRRIPTAKEIIKEEKRSIREERRPTTRTTNTINEQSTEIVIEDFGKKIKVAREARGLTQEELAKRLAIKESKLHKYETGSFVPTMDMIHSLERALGITLTESYVEKKQEINRTTSGPLTIADMIKRKK